MKTLILDHSTISFVILGFLLLFLLTTLRSVWTNPLSSLPGPPISRWTGIILKYHWLAGNRAQYVHALHQKYGPVVRLSPDEVDVSDVAAAKKIHRVGSGFLKSPWYQRLTPAGVENMFSTCNPKFHSVHRRLLSSPISDSSLRRMEPLINARVRLTIQRMQEEMKTRGVADIFKWWIFMATDIIGELSFGESFRMLEQGRENQYSLDLKKVAAVGGLRSTFPSLVKIAGFIPLPLFRTVAQAGRRMVEYAEESIQRYKRHIAFNPAESKPMLFTKLFDAGENGLSDKEIRDEAQSFIIAGSDTTANSLTYLVWATCQDDKVKTSLLQDLASLPENFNDDDVRPLRYLDQVINEALRLYAAAPSGLPRTVPPKGADIAGYWIPEGVTVNTQAYSLHRDPINFPEPERFDPSRWAMPTKAMNDAFMPFGGGSRICLGLHLARMELRLAAASFFRAFPNAKVSTLENMSDTDMEQVIYFLMSPKGKRCLIQSS